MARQSYPYGMDYAAHVPKGALGGLAEVIAPPGSHACSVVLTPEACLRLLLFPGYAATVKPRAGESLLPIARPRSPWEVRLSFRPEGSPLGLQVRRRGNGDYVLGPSRGPIFAAALVYHEGETQNVDLGVATHAHGRTHFWLVGEHGIRLTSRSELGGLLGLHGVRWKEDPRDWDSVEGRIHFRHRF